MKRTIFALAAATLLTWGAAAFGSNGVQVTTQVIPGDYIYVDCIGEMTMGVVEFTTRTHQFATPSGIGHYIDNWEFTVYTLGLTTGRIWVGHGASPWVQNGIQDERGVINISTRVQFRPFNDNGSFPSFPYMFFTWRAKLTVNANGEVAVFVPPPAVDGPLFRCFGPGY